MGEVVKARIYSYWLMAFLGLFVFRVGAQFIQVIHPVLFLPQFDAWQSGALPYHVLLVFQLAIIVFCLRIVRKFRSGTVQPSKKAGLVYLILGGVYFVVMFFRLVAGFSFAADHLWLGAHIPTIFHIILALFLLTVGFFHSPHTEKIVAWLAYPTVMLSILTGHYLCLQNNVSLQISTYSPILLGAMVITFLEMKFPHRKKWLADRNDILNDGIYMVLVQIILPKCLVFFCSDYVTRIFASTRHDI